MGFPIKSDAAYSGWSIVYIKGSQVIISKSIIFFSLKIDFILGNGTEPDVMPQHYI